MDPETCYQKIREITARIRDISESGNASEDRFSAVLAGYAEELADSWEALDGWLKSGGFLPAEWRR